MKRTQALQLSLPLAIVAAGLVTMAVAERSSLGSNPARAAVTTPTPAQTPVAEESPSVTVNGQSVTLDEHGSANLRTGSAQTTITRKDGDTTVTTTRPDGSTTTATGSGDVNVNVSSSSSNSGTSFSQSNVFQSTSGSQSSRSTTTVTTNGTTVTNSH